MLANAAGLKDNAGMHDHAHGACHAQEVHHPGGRGLILHELRAHLPFTLLATVISMAVAYAAGIHADFEAVAMGAGAHSHAGSGGASMFRWFFHAAHPAHILFSAGATTAMFLGWAGRRYPTAITLGLAGSLGLCTLSDILLPQAGALAFGATAPMHVCIVEHPAMEIIAACAGVAAGIMAARFIRRSTFFSHTAHVLISALASVFYLFPVLAGIHGSGDALLAPGLIAGMIATLTVAVLLPCCASDVVLPLLFVPRTRKEQPAPTASGRGDGNGAETERSGEPE